MTEGAREQRMRRTRRSLIMHARRLTAERGLGGFTVDELRAEVGISRRTFFNYFVSKDDAVLGPPARDPLAAYAEEFVAGGRSPGRPALLEALRRKPALLQRLTVSLNRHVADLAELIARRQVCPSGDPFTGSWRAAPAPRSPRRSRSSPPCWNATSASPPRSSRPGAATPTGTGRTP